VTFTSPDPQKLPLPEPRYLAFHAAIAKVVHTAGLAGHLDSILREREEAKVLSSDSTVDYLDHLLRIVVST
jgi:hypothetical protein